MSRLAIIASVLLVSLAVLTLGARPSTVEVLTVGNARLAAVVGQDSWWEKDGYCESDSCDACRSTTAGNYGYCSDFDAFDSCILTENEDCGWVAWKDCGYWVICDPGLCPHSCYSNPEDDCIFMMCVGGIS